MEDWQETAFNNRRIPHGKGSRGAAGGGIRGRFDARKTYGVYELTGNALGKHVPDGSRAVLEIHGRTESDDGLLGSIEIGRVFKGMVILAGSRRTLERNVYEAGGSKPEGGSRGGTYQDASSVGDDDEDDDDDDQSLEEAENEEDEFAKNTFRSPKFWVQWRAQVRSQEPQGRASTSVTGETGRGYFVFAGNNCKTFQGTLDCRSLGWKNTAVKGRQISTKVTDCPTSWIDIAMTDES